MQVYANTSVGRHGWITTIAIEQVDANAFTVTKTTEYPQAGRTDRSASTVLLHDGVLTWKKNGSVLMADVIADEHLENVPGYDAVKHGAARETQTSAVIASYRAARAKQGYSALELAEMRAAFGPGETIVDVITGEKVTL